MAGWGPGFFFQAALCQQGQGLRFVGGFEGVQPSGWHAEVELQQRLHELC